MNWQESWEGEDYLGNTHSRGYVKHKVDVPKAYFEFLPEEGK
jgi:hypothetical protein